MLFTQLKRHKMYLLGTLSVLAFIPQAVYTLSYFPPDIRDPCQITLCPPGHVCKVLPTPCARPGPCPPVATCVSPEPDSCDGFKCPQGEECRVETIFCITFPCPEPAPVCRPTNKIGSCPANLPIQRKPCSSKCTNDADCAGTLKCCGGCTRECTVAAPPLPKEKPGSCPKPKPGVFGPCIVRCGSDFECPGTAKCCGNCPKECTNVEPIVPKEKPGSCPKPTGLIGICIARCTFDSECKGDQKCCGGCPRECVNPVHLPPKEKPGSCPKPIPGSIGPCVASCTFDSDCGGDLKCCGNCPRQCTAVTIPRVKPGFCPIAHDSGSSICIKQCSDDYSCPRDSKCCVSGCRRICKRLLLDAPYVDSDPCKRQKCGRNQVCKLQKVVCKRAPCYPTAICLDKSLEDSSSVCRSGYPVVDMNSKPLSCFRACPDGTSCVKRSCCWNKEVKPPATGSCPVVYGRRQRFRCRSYRRCQTDRTCPSGRKCCRVGRCGKRCVPVN